MQIRPGHLNGSQPDRRGLPGAEMETETDRKLLCPKEAPCRARPAPQSRSGHGQGQRDRDGRERRQRASLPWKWRSSPPAAAISVSRSLPGAWKPRAPAEAAQLRAAGCASHQLPWRRWAAYRVQYRAMGYWYGNNLQLYLWTSFFHIYALIHKNKILYTI